METQNWKQLTSIQVGGAICLPVIMVGQTLAEAYGFASAVLAIVIGNLFLMGLGCIAALMSHSEKKTTIENAGDYLGKRGVSLFALAMLASMLGWFGIQLNLMTLSLVDLLGIASPSPILLKLGNVLIGVVVTYVALYGIRALNILSDISLPVLVVTLGYAFFSTNQLGEGSSQTLSFGGLSLVIAAAITVVIDLPTYFRHACSSRDGIISILIVFGIALPLIELISVRLALSHSGTNILQILQGDKGPLWNLWIALFLLLAGWTTNNTNLYSAVISLDYLMPKLGSRARTWMIGMAGTLLSCFNLLEHLELVLDLLGIVVTSMGAVILVRYLIKLWAGMILQRRDHARNLVAWGIGVGAGVLSLLGISLTAIPIVDAALASIAVTLIILINKGTYEEIYME